MPTLKIINEMQPVTENYYNNFSNDDLIDQLNNCLGLTKEVMDAYANMVQLHEQILLSENPSVWQISRLQEKLERSTNINISKLNIKTSSENLNVISKNREAIKRELIERGIEV